MQSISPQRGGQLLTIAIPTYNRCSYLELNLNRIHEEMSALQKEQRSQVKVYVSDNASTDNTALMLAQHPLHEFIEFEVVCNKENIGAERNAEQGYTNATTPYVWILGDDDVILPGGLQKVLNILQDQKTDILYVGNYHFLDNYRDAKYAREPRKEGVGIYDKSLMFVRQTNVMLTFISALIVRSKKSINYDSEIALGSNLPQLGWILPLLIDGKRFVVIKDWVVAAKGGNSGGYGLIEVFGENLQRIARDILKDRLDLATAIQNGTIVNFFPGFILELRENKTNFTDTDVKLGLEKVFSDNWRYYIFLLPLLRLPVFLAYKYNGMLNILRRLCGTWLV